MVNTSFRFTLLVVGSAVGFLSLTACQSGRTVPNAANVSARHSGTGVQPYVWVANSLLEGNGTTASLSAFGAGGEPVFAIQGNLTQLGPDIYGMVANEQNGDIYVANYNFNLTGVTNPPIVVFSNTANGNLSPKATLNSTAIGAGGISVTLDPSEDIWVGQGWTNFSQPYLLEFAKGAHGKNVAPIATIEGAKTMLTGNVDEVATDKFGNVYAIGDTASPAAAIIAEFASGTNGNKPPLRYIAGDATGLPASCSVMGITVDTEGKIYEVNGCSNYQPSIRIFLASEMGNVPPAIVIQGPNTRLNQPVSVAVDENGNIYVADNGADETLVFASGASGDATPIRILPLNPGATPPSAVTLCNAAPPCEGIGSIKRRARGAAPSRFAQHARTDLRSRGH
jgi:hypothetical protein